MITEGNSFSKKLSSVEKLLTDGKVDEGEKMLSKFDSKKLSKKTKVQYLILKAEISLKKNDFKELLVISESLKQLCNENCDNKQKIESRIYLASALWRLGRIEESIEQMEELKKDKELFTSKTNDYEIAKFNHVLGTFYWSFGKFDLALESLLISLEIREELAHLSDIAKTLNNIGLVYASLGEVDKTISFYKKSLRIKEKLKETAAVARTLNNIGSIYLKKGEIEKALKFSLRSLRLREKIGDKFEVARSNNALGNLYYEKGDVDQALLHYQTALQTFIELETQQDIAYALNNIGLMFFEKGNLINALDYLTQSLVIFKKLGNEQDIAGIFENIGQINRLRGNLTLSAENFRESLSLRKEIGNQIEIADSLEHLGYTSYLQGDYSTAIILYDECLAMRRKEDNQLYITYTLFKMITFYFNQIENNNLDANLKRDYWVKINDYSEQIKIAKLKSKHQIIITLHQLVNSLVILHDTSATSFIEAEEILLSISIDLANTYQTRVYAVITLCSIYFKDYFETGQIKTLKKIKTLVDRMLKFAQKEQITSSQLLFQTLKAKLAVIEYKKDTALDLLNQTKKQALDSGFDQIVNQCDVEIERISEMNLVERVVTSTEREKELLASSIDLVNFLKEMAIEIQYTDK